MLNFILLIILLAGIAMLLYPTVSEYWNSIHQSQVIGRYEESLETIDQEEYSELLEMAEEYNQKLIDSEELTFVNGEPVSEIYQSQLEINDSGMIGSIEIPSADINLPIYLGTSESVLSVGVGHLEGSSLPIGGESTHTVLAGHRGLPSSSLFTNLDQIEIGDVFTVTVLGDVIAYEVYQITIVEPDEISDLLIEEGKELCTLITCTPYGVNTHRMLVQGYRVEYEEQSELTITEEAILIDPTTVAFILAVGICLVMVMILMVRTKLKRRKNENVKK